MNIELINQVRAFTQWTRDVLNKSSCFEIDFWSHSCNDKEEPTYRIWVEDLISKESKDIESLAELLPKLRQYCELNKECLA